MSGRRGGGKCPGDGWARAGARRGPIGPGTPDGGGGGGVGRTVDLMPPSPAIGAAYLSSIFRSKSPRRLAAVPPDSVARPTAAALPLCRCDRVAPAAYLRMHAAEFTDIPPEPSRGTKVCRKL